MRRPVLLCLWSTVWSQISRACATVCRCCCSCSAERLAGAMHMAVQGCLSPTACLPSWSVLLESKGWPPQQHFLIKAAWMISLSADQPGSQPGLESGDQVYLFWSTGKSWTQDRRQCDAMEECGREQGRDTNVLSVCRQQQESSRCRSWHWSYLYGQPQQALNHATAAQACTCIISV